jgi:hypothetical protein
MGAYRGGLAETRAIASDLGKITADDDRLARADTGPGEPAAASRLTAAASALAADAQTALANLPEVPPW